jgi:hypothetical protein
MGPSVKRARDQPAIPLQEGVWGGNCGHFGRARGAEHASQGREAPVPRVRKVQPALVELCFEEAVFFL